MPDLPGLTIDHRTLAVDGVRVHHFPSDDDRTSATLIFGVGGRNETLPTGGTLHTLEHLVMDVVRRTPIEINASVGPSSTEFTAAGSPDLVGRFLQGVCRTLADPPVDRLEAEIRVLEAEDHSESPESGSPLALVRYGWRDLAIPGGPTAGPRGVTADSLRATAHHWFVASNAVLIIDGPWPDGLRLPLTDGVVQRESAPVRTWSSPHAITIDEPICAVSLLLPASSDHRELLATALICNRLEEELRHRRGQVYGVDPNTYAIAGDRWDLQIFSEPPPDRAREAAKTMITTLLQLLREGPTPEELALAQEQATEAGRGRDAQIGTVLDLEISRLLGRDVSPFDPGVIGGLSLDDITAYLRHLSDDALFLVDERAEDDLAALGVALVSGPGERAPLPPGEVFRPGLFARAINREARDSRVSLTSTGLAHLLAGEVQTIAWPDVAGVMRESEGDLVVFGLDGSAIPVGPGLYKGGQRLAEAVRDHVPDALVYDAPAGREDEEAARP